MSVTPLCGTQLLPGALSPYPYLPPIGDPMDASWIQLLAAGSIGFGSAVFAEPLRARLFRSRIDLSFAQTGGGLIETNVIHAPSHAHSTGEEAKYVRLKVVNQSSRIARKLRVFLTSVEVQDLSQKYVQTAYSDSMQVGWSARSTDRFDAIDLPSGITAFVDALSARATRPGLLSVDVDSWPSRYEQLFYKGVFRFTFIATGDNIKPTTTRLTLAWSEHWDSLRMAVPD